MQRDEMRECEIQREKEENKTSLALCGLGKRTGRRKGEEGLWLGEMSCSTAALGAILGGDVNND